MDALCGPGGGSRSLTATRRHVLTRHGSVCILHVDGDMNRAIAARHLEVSGRGHVM